jgi:hypothetical protein
MCLFSGGGGVGPSMILLPGHEPKKKPEPIKPERNLKALIFLAAALVALFGAVACTTTKHHRVLSATEDAALYDDYDCALWTCVKRGGK